MKRKQNSFSSDHITDDRMIKVPATNDFEAPDILKHKPLSETDKSMIDSLTNSLLKSGAISDDDNGYEAYDQSHEQSLEEIDELIEEANSVAQYEKDFNNEYYDEEAETYLDEIAKRTGAIENELLDGKDDFGEQVFDDARDRVIQKNKDVPSVVQSGSKVSFRMPNGSTIHGSIVQPMNDD